MCKHQVPKPGFKNLPGLETRGQPEIPSKTRPRRATHRESRVSQACSTREHLPWTQALKATLALRCWLKSRAPTPRHLTLGTVLQDYSPHR